MGRRRSAKPLIAGSIPVTSSSNAKPGGLNAGAVDGDNHRKTTVATVGAVVFDETVRGKANLLKHLSSMGAHVPLAARRTCNASEKGSTPFVSTKFGVCLREVLPHRLRIASKRLHQIKIHVEAVHGDNLSSVSTVMAW